MQRAAEQTAALSSHEQVTENDGGAEGRQVGGHTNVSAHGRRRRAHKAPVCVAGASSARHRDSEALLNEGTGLLHSVNEGTGLLHSVDQVPAADYGQGCQAQESPQDQGADNIKGSDASCEKAARVLASGCGHMRPCHDPHLPHHHLPQSAAASPRASSREAPLLSPFPFVSEGARDPESAEGLSSVSQLRVPDCRQGVEVDAVGGKVRKRADVTGTCAACACVHVCTHARAHDTWHLRTHPQPTLAETHLQHTLASNTHFPQSFEALATVVLLKLPPLNAAPTNLARGRGSEFAGETRRGKGRHARRAQPVATCRAQPVASPMAKPVYPSQCCSFPEGCHLQVSPPRREKG